MKNDLPGPRVPRRRRPEDPRPRAVDGAASRYHLISHKVASQVVLQNSIPTQIRQLIIYISNSKGSVDGFVGELTSAERL